MKLIINQWGGSKGLTLSLLKNRYSINIYPSILAAWRLRKIYKPSYKETLFSIKRNRRYLVTLWDVDISICGFTLQINRYKDYMRKFK